MHLPNSKVIHRVVVNDVLVPVALRKVYCQVYEVVE